MNGTIRRTRACTIETMDQRLREAIRSHGREYGLQDLETDVLMCCETLSAWQRKGFQGGIWTSLSAVYVTSKWLAWADGTRDQAANAGTAPLEQIHVSGYSDGYGLTDQELSLSVRHTSKNSTETIFLLLDSRAEGLKFRQVLQQALRACAAPKRN